MSIRLSIHTTPEQANTFWSHIWGIIIDCHCLVFSRKKKTLPIFIRTKRDFVAKDQKYRIELEVCLNLQNTCVYLSKQLKIYSKSSVHFLYSLRIVTQIWFTTNIQLHLLCNCLIKIIRRLQIKDLIYNCIYTQVFLLRSAWALSLQLD